MSDLAISITASAGSVLTAEIDATTRKVRHLAADDERLQEILVTLATLTGVIEGELDKAFRARQSQPCPYCIPGIDNCTHR